MATAGAYKGVAFTFNYSFVTASDPTTLFTGTLLTSEVQVITRDGATTNAAANIASAPTHESNGVFEVNLSASEMNHDEIVLVLVPSAADVVVESISITTEPTPVDVVEISSDAAAANNLESQYDGTGLSGSNYPATQSALGAVSANVNSVLIDTSITIPGQISGLNDIAATDIVTSGPITTLAGAVVNVDTVDTVTTNSDMITVSAIADGVWDEAQSGHVTVGTFGYYLDDQVSGISGGGGGTDWTTTEKNQIRYRLGVDGTSAAPTATPDLSTFDATTDTVVTDTASRNASKADVSALATQASVDVVDANVDAILVDTGTTLPASIAAIDTNVDAVLVDTGTTIPSTLSTISSKVDTVDAVADLIKVETAAILDDTGTSGVTVSTAQAQAIADEILKRSVSNVEGATLSEHSLATIVLAILESSRSGSSWTIKRTDGATTQVTKTLTLDNAADPVVGVQ